MQGTPPITSDRLSIPGKSSPKSRTIHRSSSAFSARVISESIRSLSAGVLIALFISFSLRDGNGRIVLTSRTSRQGHVRAPNYSSKYNVGVERNAVNTLLPFQPLQRLGVAKVSGVVDEVYEMAKVRPLRVQQNVLSILFDQTLLVTRPSRKLYLDDHPKV